MYNLLIQDIVFHKNTSNVILFVCLLIVIDLKVEVVCAINVSMLLSLRFFYNYFYAFYYYLLYLFGRNGMVEFFNEKIADCRSIPDNVKLLSF